MSILRHGPEYILSDYRYVHIQTKLFYIMANKIGVIIVVVAVIGVVSAVVLSQEGGITSNSGEKYFQMIKDSSPSNVFGEWDCSTFQAIRDFEKANEKAILEYQGSLSEREINNLSITLTQWRQNCG